MSESLTLISIVRPFYFEEESIEAYFTVLLPILNRISASFEIICIADGSSDKTFALPPAQASSDKRIKILQLARNFGKEAALTAGLDYASGAAIIALDADLQEPPSLIPQMVKIWEEGKKNKTQIDVVLPVRQSRSDPMLKRITASIFYSLIKKISTDYIPANAADFRLLDRRVLLIIRQLKERHSFMRGIMSWPGFNTHVIPYHRTTRKFGCSKYNYKKMLSYAFDGLIAFATVPLRFFAVLGMFIILGDLALIIWSLPVKLSGNALQGFTSLMLVLLFLGGAILLGLGILGEYIGCIYDEVKQRPIYVIREQINIE